MSLRIAALSDIHGNLPALDAVLADIARRGCDLVVNLGDIVSGPLWPRETLERLQPLQLPTIAGNHERQLLGDPATLATSDAHARQSLLPAQLGWIRTLPPLQRIDDVLLCHGTPDSDVDYLLDDIVDSTLHAADPATVAARLTHPLAGDAALVLCGHSHTPRVLRLADGRLACNPGSVGLPAFATTRPVPHRAEAGSPEARYALLERRGGQWQAQLLGPIPVRRGRRAGRHAGPARLGARPAPRPDAVICDTRPPPCSGIIAGLWTCRSPAAGPHAPRGLHLPPRQDCLPMNQIRKTSALAITSLVSGILGWTLLPFIGTIVAIITGHMARSEIRASNGQLDGDGLAIAGLVLGWVSVILVLIAIFVIFAFLGGVAWLAALNS